MTSLGFSDSRNTYANTTCVFASNPVSSLKLGGASVVTMAATNILMFNDGNLFEVYNQTAVGNAATQTSGSGPGTGINISTICNAASMGAEWGQGSAPCSKGNRTVNVSGAFFIECKFKVTTDNLVTELFIGFRKQGVYTPTLSSYSDFATIGIHGVNSPAKIQIQTQLASGGVTVTDTTNTWASGATHILRVNVSSTGVVTYLIDGVAPSTTAALTLTASQNVVPFVWYVTPVGGSAEVDWIYYKEGNQ